MKPTKKFCVFPAQLNVTIPPAPPPVFTLRKYQNSGTDIL